MFARAKATVFELFHPVVAAVYFAVVLIFCMAAFHPVLIAVSLVGGLCANARLRGVKPVLLTLRWQLALLVVIALANLVFASRGSTLLATVGPFPLYLESFIYGLCMGAMLVAAMLWCSNAAAVMSSDKVSALLGSKLPVVGLMLVMVMRLVPQFVRRGRLIGQAAAATTSACAPNKAAGVFGELDGAALGPATAPVADSQRAPSQNGAAERVRQIVVLMGWSLEDSLEMSDAMRARGWGAARRRTTYRRVSFGVVDASCLVVVCALALGLAVSAGFACAQSSFYPVVEPGAAWPLAALVYVVVLAIPPVLEVIEWLTWRSNS